MWNKKQYPDHTYDESRTNAVTPVTHLFVRTTETNCSVSINCDEKIRELNLTKSHREETVIHLKRTGNAVSVLLADDCHSIFANFLDQIIVKKKDFKKKLKINVESTPLKVKTK